ncbi:hypothetical protein, variant [Spizellomyces punctatus DAOM BR117]|nr:hypothetical protein, variant [Spizellomyces punctatus DAOM BR117]KND03328.1 hypothetical protein, variant [Spizellomyces punctatus DAOM BR117]|eukprot:XP_016611367.1 hypothetical protein, variant [Spizellomyces punctatus DAOM BR117]
MTDPDKELRERFEKLKVDTAKSSQSLPSDEELYSRLKSLTGSDPVASIRPQPLPSERSFSTVGDTGHLEAEIAALLQEPLLLSDVDIDIAYENERISVPPTPVPGEGHEAFNNTDGGKYVDYTNLLLTSPTKSRLERPDVGDDPAVASLLQEIQEEVQLEKKYGVVAGVADSELEKRMKGLREFVPPSRGASPSVEVTGKEGPGKSSDTHPKSQLGLPPTPPSFDDFVNEEDMWCCICNDDATVRCKECDDDPYCNRCFKEGHEDDYELKRHVAIKIAKQTRKQS